MGSFSDAFASHGANAPGRLRWLLVFVLMLSAISAVPVLAADAPSGSPADVATLPSSSEETPPLPDDHDIREAREAEEREEAERERWLQSPEATQERKESRLAFAGIGAEEAKELLPTLFAAQFAALNADPARFLSDAQLLRPLGEEETAATVSDDGHTTLMEAGIPVRAEDESGELRKVDLSLEAKEGGFETRNAHSDVYVPDSAAEPIEVGEDGLSIVQAGARESHTAQLLGDENIYYHDVLEDTGMIVSPIAGGVELFNVLYSEESPETLSYDLDLLEGATLRSTSTGGAEIIRDGSVLGLIPFPTAVDAQGTDVPVEMKIDGTSLSLDVAHRDEDYAMPILVDPILENWGTAWYFGSNLKAIDYWQYASNDQANVFRKDRKCISADLCSPSNAGLFMTSEPKNLPAGIWGHWYYYVPGGTTFIPFINYPGYSAHFNPFWRNNHGCNWENTPRPFDYNGSFDANGNWIWYEINRSMVDGTATMYTKAKGVAFGMSTGNGGSMPCWRSLMLGGTVINLDDPEAPTLNSISGFPSGWFGDATKISATANSSDPGLGVKYVTVTQSGKGVIAQDQVACTGIATEPCPGTRKSSFGFTALSLGEGIRKLYVAAQDPLGKGSNSYEVQTKVDRSSPEVVLDGHLAEVTEEDQGSEQGDKEVEQLRLAVYNLKVETTDGKPTSADEKDWRSGVKDIEVYLDGVEQTVPWTAQGCSGPKFSCPMTKTYELKLAGVKAGLRMLKVVAIDQVGNSRERSIEFEYLPSTGMKEEYVMHYFPLPDGLGNEEEEEHPARPELAVNVMNGNLVYRERDFEVQGAAVDLELERFYNSQLPDSESTEWGDGWTLAETPELDPGEGPTPSEAEIVDSSGALDDELALPAKVGEEEFNPELQVTISKEPDGGYEMTDETGESGTSVAFNEDGRAEALRAEGYAKVDYKYEAGHLSEIEVQDPATFAADPEELEIDDGLVEKPTYVSSFGKNGSADGQFASPADVAIDSAGNLWVVDRGNNRLQKFGPGGKFITKFGSAGKNDKQFNAPTSVAIDPKGNLWVVDKWNHRVQKFDSSGNFLLKAGTQGSGKEQFKSPESITVDAKGNVLVCDTLNGRIQKLSESGVFLQEIGVGKMTECTGVDVGPYGRIWAGDWVNHRVNVFEESGTWLWQFGKYGSGPGEFKNPDAVEIDAQGNAYIGDQNNYRVQQLNSESKFVAQFGGYGSGDGQFNFSYPLGVETDSKGNLWVADVNNHRIQHWRMPITEPLYDSSFGSYGWGEGQLQNPADVALSPDGSLWVVDRLNYRIQKFSPDGKFLLQFGKEGEGPGEFWNPASIAVDRDGNLLVLDKTARRVQKFSPDGKFLLQFGSSGSGNGQFSFPEGIAADLRGNIWVCDGVNARIQRFDEEGKFIEVVGSKGAGEGQFGRCAGIDVGLDGRVWAGDWTNNRVNVFSPEGKFLFAFGSSGSGQGQFNRPAAIEVDRKGNVWVGDQANHRVQQFNSEGKYVRQFGSNGSGPGQFKLALPLGLETDSKGHLWIADVNNHRIQRWLTDHYAPVEAEPIELSDGDPGVQIESEGGLISSVEGTAAGEHSYEHEGDALVSHEGPDGETTYEYDGAGRMTKVTLANGTWAEIEYDSYGRVKSVEVAPEGSNPETTYFNYSGEPRRTTVIPPNAPDLVYDIGADGSVLKWWNKVLPPELKLAGTLYDNREEEDSLIVGDHLLEAQAYSPEGMASIKVIANNSQLVDEMTCEQKEGVGCVNPPLKNEWVTETGAHAPGHLTLEVIATDHDGMSSSERFWVDIPEPPPPPPVGSPVPPKFNEIKRFREEHGLEIVFPVANETELNERIFDLITAWWNPQTPAGEVARASWERWGVPLRPVDVAELDWRLAYWNHASSAIPAWASANAPGTFAGVYIDERAGGKVRAGFTSNQVAAISALKETELLAPDRLLGFSVSPSHSLSNLQSLEGAIFKITGPGSESINTVSIDQALNKIRVGASDVQQVKNALVNEFGAQAPVEVFYEPIVGSPRERKRDSGAVRAGDFITSPYLGGAGCTAGFGAWEKGETQENGSQPRRLFLLVAGHCIQPLDKVQRPNPSTEALRPFGIGKRIGLVWGNYGGEVDGWSTDATAVKVSEPHLAARQIVREEGKELIDVTSAVESPGVGTRVCHSGISTETERCGPILSPPRALKYVPITLNGAKYFWQICYEAQSIPGDSGGPVWIEGTGKAVGLISYGWDPHDTSVTCYTPLKPLAGRPAIPGALRAPGMGELNPVVRD